MSHAISCLVKRQSDITVLAVQCVVSATGNGELVAVDKMYERSPYFPSMSVKGANADTFKNAQWIIGSYQRQKVGIIASTRPSEASPLPLALFSAPHPSLPSRRLLVLPSQGHSPVAPAL